MLKVLGSFSKARLLCNFIPFYSSPCRMEKSVTFGYSFNSKHNLVAPFVSVSGLGPGPGFFVPG